MSAFDKVAIDALAHVNVALGTNPISSAWCEREAEPRRVFLAVEPTHIAVVFLRDSLDLLANVDERLPVTFYALLRRSIAGRVLCYEEAEAKAYFEYRTEAYEELKEAGDDEESLELPESIEQARGPWLDERYRPFSTQETKRLTACMPPSSRERCILEGASHLSRTARKWQPMPQDWRLIEAYCGDGYYVLPFTILAFHEQDLVCQAFQDDEEQWLNGGESAAPAFFRVIDPRDPASIRCAFSELRNLLRVLEALGTLLKLLPGCDLLEVEQ